MPTSIELAISDTLSRYYKSWTSFDQKLLLTPHIGLVLAAYMRIAGFTDPSSLDRPPFNVLPPPEVTSAFERALEKFASPHSKNGSDTASIVERVRRQYWIGALIASGSPEDELTQLLMALKDKDSSISTPEPLCETSSDSSLPMVSSPKSPFKPQRKKVESLKSELAPASTTTEIRNPFVHDEDIFTDNYALAAMLAGPGSSVSSHFRSGHSIFTETGHVHVKGQGIKPLYRCPCCGDGVRAHTILRVLNLVDEEDLGCSQCGAEISPKKRKGSAKGTRQKTKETTPKTKAKHLAAPQVIFDPYAPSTSHA